jgi:hypothetical protein
VAKRIHCHRKHRRTQKAFLEKCFCSTGFSSEKICAILWLIKEVIFLNLEFMKSGNIEVAVPLISFAGLGKNGAQIPCSGAII